MGHLTLRVYRGGIASMATLIPAIGTSADKLHAELDILIITHKMLAWLWVFGDEFERALQMENVIIFRHSIIHPD